MPFALIARLLTGEAGIYFARLRNMATWYVVMGVFGLITVIFLLMALFAWVETHLGPILTALVFAGVFLVLTLVAFLLARSSAGQPKGQRAETLQREIASIAGVTAMSNAPQIFRLMRRKRGLVIIPMAALGFLGLYKAITAFRDE
ncbi:hypothetical protein GCM10011390_43580 [Aureimonas endophytica]|uniref:Uncharacterized protein n=1 Tax=Aureimonas endophytica TaxID=2027858 RepID=A0A916ZZ18_9HYPH|nr:phage holin family protein [Aureimonas endophytica]GGE19631.1 hypothetical protein GCM10011390_43580 [Aureimonas endophytica]